MEEAKQPRSTNCARTRLAENHVAAVDVCECGMMHLHLGPFSLRLTPEALGGLLDTLARATGALVTRPGTAAHGLRGHVQGPRGEA